MSDALAGRVCVVTGATSGIGLEVARLLAADGATLVLACRDLAAGERCVAELAEGNREAIVEAMAVDVSSQASIRAFAAGLAGRHPRVHVLVNNAGVWLPGKSPSRSPDGYELTWATNVLGTHLVTRALEPLLVAGAPARVVNVVSTYVGDFDATDVQFERRGYDGIAAYKASKLADRILSWAWAERLAPSGVTVNACHPGGVATGIYRNPTGLFGAVLRAYVRLVKRTPAQGARTPAWLASSADVAGQTGRFYSDQRERACPYRDPEGVARLWTICEAMTAPA